MPPGKPLGGAGFQPGGSRFQGGYVVARDYLNQEFSYPQLYRTADIMYRTDSVVRAAMMMVLLPVIEASWTFTPASPSDEDVEAAELCRRALLEHLDWSDTIYQLLAPTLRYGHGLVEEVYETVEWELSVPVPDGELGEEKVLPKRTYFVPAAFVPRPGCSIIKWKFNDLGEIEEVVQLTGQDKMNDTVTIPGSRLVAMFNEREGQEDLGRSVLRSMYRPWYAKEKLEIIDMIRAEKTGVGVPLGRVGTNVSDGDLAALETQLQEFSANEKGYLILNGLADEGEQGMDVEMLDMRAGSTADVLSSMRYYVEQILWGVLGAWQNLGQGEVGARATAEAQDDPFYLALEYVAGRVAESFARQHLPRLVGYNIPDATPPTLTVASIGGDSNREAAEGIAKLLQYGGIKHDEALEAHLRDLYGLPPATPKDEKDVEEEEPLVDPLTGLPVPPPPPEPDPVEDDATGKPEEEPDPKNDSDTAEKQQKAMFARLTQDIALAIGRGYRDAAALVANASPTSGEPTPREAFLDLVANGRVEHTLVSASEATDLLLLRSRKWSREPTALEAAHVSLAEIDVVIDAQRLRFQKRLTEHAHALARHLADRSLPDEAEEKLRHDIGEALLAVVDYGREKVRSEVASQRGVKTVLAAPKDPKKLDAWIQKQARRATTAIVTRLESAADRVRSRPIEAGHEAVVTTLTREADRSLRAEAIATVGQAFSAGRADEMENLREQFSTAEYSSVLDSSTCGPCSSLDGEQYEVGSDEYDRDYPPLNDCEGGDACRCMMILIATSEVQTDEE